MPITIADASHRSASVGKLHKPRTLKQVQAILRHAIKHGSLLTTVGGRSGLTGSSVPLFGGDGIDMSHYLSVEPRPGYTSFSFQLERASGNYLLSDAEPKTGVFPAGITLAEMDNLLRRQHLFYAPKPGYMGGQLGGAVATNASGPRTLAFGDTRANVVGLQVVLPDGDIVNLRRNDAQKHTSAFTLPGITSALDFPDYLYPAVKNAAGFYASPTAQPIDLFVGCEGTLGIFTEVEVRLITRQPIVTKLYFFESVAGALGFVDRLRSKSYDWSQPAKGGVLSLEFMDKNALYFVSDLLNSRHINSQGLDAAIEVEYMADSIKADRLLRTYSEKYAAVNPDLNAEFIMQLRYSIPQGVNALMAKRGFVKIASDFAVPGPAFKAMYSCYQAADAAMAEITGLPTGSATWGHIGNYHLHWNALPNSKVAVVKALELYQTLGEAAVKLGGTLSAEHGTGKKQLVTGEPLLYTMNKNMYDYAVELIQQINPGYLLNRGNMIGYPVHAS